MIEKMADCSIVREVIHLKKHQKGNYKEKWQDTENVFLCSDVFVASNAKSKNVYHSSVIKKKICSISYFTIVGRISALTILSKYPL